MKTYFVRDIKHLFYIIFYGPELTAEYRRNYRLYGILNIFPFILLSSNLCQSPSYQTVSNAFAKSTSAQCNFFFLFFKILKREWRINKLSKIEYPFRNPFWFSHSTRNSSEYCVSLSLKIEVNTLPKQLKTVIGLKFWGHLHDP